MKFIRPKTVDFQLFNKFTGELYLELRNHRYDRTKMANGYYRRLILIMKLACAQSWNVDKRFVKLRLNLQY